MRTISIQDLKSALSAAVAEAESGTTLVITRHNRPVAQLRPAGTRRTARGPAVGTVGLTPAIRRGTKGRYLAVLQEDRGHR